MKNVLRKTWAILTSLELAVVLILILAVFQIIGSVVPQNMEPEYYADAWSPGTYETLKTLGLLSIFRSPVFVVPALLLGINLASCAISIVARFFTKKVTHRDFVSALYHLALFAMFAGFFTTFLVSFGGKITLAPDDETTVPFKWSETNWYRFAPRFGMEAPPDAESDFKIRLVSFDTTNVEMGGDLFVKDWTSSIQVIENGEIVKEKDIEVNDPMVYGGLKFYQANYIQRITLDVDREKVEVTVKARAYAPLTLGDEDWQVRPVRHGTLLTDEEPEPIEPYLELKPPDGEGKNVRLDRGKEKDVSGHNVTFIDFDESSVLTYKRDPAVKYLWVLWMVFTGLIAVRVYIQEPYRRWFKKPEQ
jgi:cytochrome c biogenesis protein ResB